MAISKVIYNNQTLIDLTGLQITASDVAEGYTTHNSAGVQITGTASTAGCVAYKANDVVNLVIPTSIGSVSGTTLTLVEA